MTPDPAPYGADLPRPVTPGPWEALDVDDEDVPVVVEHPPAFEGVVTIAMTKAWNAHAIAAVPEYVTALDAANAEVLARRAQCAALIDRCTEHEMVIGALEDERDALRQVVEAVRALSAIVDPPLPSIVMLAARRGDLMSGYRLALELVAALLPAPTEPSNLYPPARGAVAPTTTPQAPGGSGANTGEAGRG